MRNCYRAVIARRPKADEAISFRLLRMLRILAMTMCVISLLCCVTFAIENAEEAEFMSAKKAFTDSYYDISQARLEAFLKGYPQTTRLYEAHQLLGRCYYNQNNFSRAVYEFDMILNSQGPGNLQDGALYWSGEAYLRMGDYRKALEYYDKIAGSLPSSRYYAFSVYSKGYAYYKLGMYEDAIKCYGEVVSKFPFEKVAVESQFRIGECEYLLARYADVERDLGVFIEKYPVSDKTAESHYMLGESLFYQAKFGAAFQSFSRALSIAPKSAWSDLALYRMADAGFRVGEYSKSIELYKRVIAAGASEFLESSSLLGLCRNYEKIGVPAEARAACDELISEYPSSDDAGEAICVKARLFLNERRFAEAAGICRDAIEKYRMSPAIGRLHYELGASYYGLARHEEGLREFEWVRSESKDPDLVTASLCKIGDIFLEMSDHRKALESYDNVLDKYPDSQNAGYAQFQIGNSYFAAGKFQQAAMAYHSTLANFPNSSLRQKTIFQLGASYYKMKDYVRASQEFSDLIKDYPASDPAAVRSKLYLADSLYNMNKYNEALSLYMDIERQHQDNAISAKALYQTGWCYYSMRKEPDAISAFTRFLREYPESGLVLETKLSLALVFADEGRPDEAVKVLEDAASGTSDTDLTGKAYRQIAQALERLDRLDEAARLYEKLVAMGTDESKFAKERLDRIRHSSK